MKQKEKLVDVVEATEYVVGLRDDGIIHVYYKPGTVIDVPLQHELVAVFDEITKGEKKCFIYEAGKSCSITNQARRNAIQLESEIAILASAVFTTNAFYRIIADFYYRVNRPKTPYNFFGRFDDAIKWLRSFQ